MCVHSVQLSVCARDVQRMLERQGLTLLKEVNSFNIRCCIQVQERLDKAILLNAAFRYGMERGLLHFFHHGKNCIHVSGEGTFYRQVKGQGLKPPLMSMCALACF